VTVIDIDRAVTWPEDVRREVEGCANRLRGATRFTSDLPILPDDEDAFRARLDGRPLRTYHATRLLDHERDAITREGLLPLTAELVERRIDLANRVKAITADQRRTLSATNVFALGCEEYRENQVCLTLGEGSLDEIGGVWRLLSTWGGEAIYWANERSELGDRLKPLGSPTVVAAAVDLTAGWRTHLVSPGVLHCFVGRTLGLERPFADVFYRARVPPERVLEIWGPGDAEYDRHAGLPRL
jgi:hypothetical protein